MAEGNEFDVFAAPRKPVVTTTPDTERVPQTPDRPPTIAARPRGVVDVNEFDPFASNKSVPKPKGVFTDWSKFNKPFGEIKAVDRKPSEQFQSDLQDSMIGWGAKPYMAGKMAGIGSGIVNATPIGSVFAGADLAHDLSRGNYVNSLLDTIGVLPGALSVRNAMRPARELIPANAPPSWIQPGRPSNRTTGIPEPNAWTENQVSGWTTPSNRELQNEVRQNYGFGDQSPVRWHPDSMRDFTHHAEQYLRSPNHGRGVFTPEGSPELFDLLGRQRGDFPGTQPPRPPVNLGFNPAVTTQPAQPVPRVITPTDYDAFRQALRSLPGSSGAGGGQVAELLDAYMLSPHSRIVQGTPQDIAELAQSFNSARGNYRSLRTNEPVVDAIRDAVIRGGTQASGFNTGNVARQKVSAFAGSDAGRERLFGARPDEVRLMEDVGQGDPGTNALRYGSNILGGGGGMYQGMVAAGSGTAAASIATLLGLGTGGAGIAAVAAPAATTIAGRAMRAAANERTLEQSRNVAAQIRRNSPLGEENLQMAGRNLPLAQQGVLPTTPGTVEDRGGFFRDMITTAMMPELRKAASDSWDAARVPQENAPQSTDDNPLRITVRPRVGTE